MASSRRHNQLARIATSEEQKSVCLLHAREQLVPLAVMLTALGARARELSIQDAQLVHILDFEVLPAVRRPAATFALI
jgi:hypothetical protein